MASTPTGAVISIAHRNAQLALRARAIRSLLPVWASLDLDTLRASWPAVEQAMIGIIAEQRPQSASLASGYYQAFRAAEGVAGTAEAAPVAVTSDVTARAAVSLRVTGLLSIEHAAVLQEPTPLATAFVRVSGVLAKHVLDGGRETVQRAIARDRRALGYARVTSGKPCHWCAMLASRGPVYSEGGVRFRSHPACACTSEPVFRTDTEWPGNARKFRALYDSVAKGKPDAALAFRRAYEGRAA